MQVAVLVGVQRLTRALIVLHGEKKKKKPDWTSRQTQAGIGHSARESNRRFDCAVETSNCDQVVFDLYVVCGTWCVVDGSLLVVPIPCFVVLLPSLVVQGLCCILRVTPRDSPLD